MLADGFDHVSGGCQAAEWQPHDISYAGGSPIGPPNVEHYNPSSIDHSLLTGIQEHEPQSYFETGISQSPEQAWAEDSQSQSTFDLFLSDVPTPPSSLFSGNQISSHFDGISSPTSLASSSATPSYYPNVLSSTPTSEETASDSSPEGKARIRSTQGTSTCATCRKSFSSSLRYKQHMDHRLCQALHTCNGCGHRFKHSKDLERHQGLRGSASSCSAVRNTSSSSKRFACICGTVSYTRKDSLQRHIDREKRRNTGQQHAMHIVPA